MTRHDPTTRSRPARSLTAVLALTLIGLLPVLLGGPAQADTAPPDVATPATVSSDPLPTAQIDGVVWSQVVVGTTVFVGGDFAKARPADAPAGTQTVDRHNLLAYDITTGELVPDFAPDVNQPIKAVAASPDGSTLYVAGTFDHVGTEKRNRLAAFSVATGALLPFDPNLNYTAASLAVTDTTVYVGGGFTSVGTAQRQGVAAISRTTGLALPFAATIPTGKVLQVIVSPDRSKVVIGGNFETVNGSSNPGYGLALLNATTGASLPMPVNSLIRDARTNSAIDALAAAPDGFYGGGYAVGKADGNLEGAFKADWDGNLVWVEDCHGDTYSIFPSGDAVYVAGHPHYCGNVGGFPQTDPWTFQRAIAFSRQPTGTISREPLGYFNYEGQPRPSLLHWFPDFSTGTYTKKGQGPWSVTGNADYLVYGGEFTSVNFRDQQGLVRFARSGVGSTADGPRLSSDNYVPKVQQFAAGVRLSWPANYDRDNEELTYKLIKNGNASAPVFSATARSTFWRRPNLAYLDTGLSPGQTATYRLRVTDPQGNIAWGTEVSVTASGTGPALDDYDKTALSDGPQTYWPLNETSGTQASDIAGPTGTTPATRTAAVTTGVPGAVPGGSGKAYRFPGTSAGFVSTTTARPAPQIFSAEAWFRTTSTTGGKIIGFGNSSTGDSGSIDRHVYLGNTGQVSFGVYPMTPRVVSSPAGYNDGKWHHMVATLSPAGQYLYLDGQLVGSRTDTVSAQIATGFWRIGGDRVGTWAGAGSSGYLAGDIDDPAIYPVALTTAQVKAHFDSVSQSPPVDAPFVDDGFDRTLATGLGNADVGGAWTVSSASGFAVQSGVAQAKLSTAGTSRTAFLGATTRTSTDITSTQSVDKTAVGGNILLTQQSRRVSSTAGYQATVKVNTTNKLSVTLEALKGASTATALAPAVVLPTTYTAGTPLHTRLQTYGTSPTTVRVKVWLGSDPEPSSWTSTATDTYAGLQTAGAVGLSAYLSSSATNAPVTVSVSTLTARPVP